MNKNYGLVIINTVSFAFMLFINYASNAGIFSNVTVADISHKYDTLFAPAGYAFLIWTLIFLFGAAFVIYQWLLLKKGDPHKYISRTGVWFTVSNIANALWVYCWINELLGLCVIVILLLLLSLCILTVRLRLELDDEPIRTIFFIWWPIAFYLGWIMVATIACVASWFIYYGWHGGSIGEDVWTIIMIIIACLLYLFLLQTRNLRESATVGVWAFIAIAVRQWSNYNNIVITAIAASAILLIFTGIHGYRHRNYGVNAKIKRGEWK